MAIILVQFYNLNLVGLNITLGKSQPVHLVAIMLFASSYGVWRGCADPGERIRLIEFC